jgi:Trk K+ transport system NAD-binding subunit
VGLECIKALRGYCVPVRAIDLQLPTGLTLDSVALTQGDFREPETLQRAGLQACRSIVLVSGNSAANIEGALAARRANPSIRLVVRSEQQRWHDLLSQQLGNLVVYEPNRLSAAAFAFATLDGDVLAHFYVDGELFQVVEHRVNAGDRWVGLPIEALHMPRSQVLLHAAAEPPDVTPSAESAFYGWRPDQTVGVGDRVLTLSTGRVPSPTSITAAQHTERRSPLAPRFSKRLLERLERPEKIALASLSVLVTLLLIAVAAFAWSAPRLPLHEALRLALMLLTGGHLADVFVNFDTLPAGVRWTEILLTITGTLLTAVLYALLTDRLLTTRFQLLARRPRPPARDHVIIAGLGATGERIAGLLQDLHRPVVGVEKDPIDTGVLPKLPVIRGSATEQEILEQAKLSTAHGLVAATAHDLQNIEIALLASALNPDCRIAVRMSDPRLTANVSFLLPQAKILCVSSLAATAYAAAALGEHVISLFQALETSVLVVEYHVTQGDTLAQRGLWEIAEGYAVVPVLYQHLDAPARVLTPDDAALRLGHGDRLVVLATAAGLEAIERGDFRPREYELWLEQLRPYAEPLQVVGMLTQRLGYTLESARDVLAHLPQRVPQRFYGLYGLRTQRALRVNGLQASLRRVDEAGEASAPVPPRPQSRVDWTQASRAQST